jgi:hypothetical protein
VVHAAQKVVEPGGPLFRGPVVPKWRTETRLRSCIETGGFRTKDIETKRSTVTAHMKDMVNGMNHFVEAMAMMVVKSWILEEEERLTVELRKGFVYWMAKPAQFDVEVLTAVARR